MDPTKKNHATTKSVRVDHEAGLIYIPGLEDPLDLIAPMRQQMNADGVPTPHMLTQSEIIELRKGHERRLSLMRQHMAAKWQCTQCQKIWPGTQCRVKWDKIAGVKSEFLFCPDVRCDAPCVMLREVPPS